MRVFEVVDDGYYAAPTEDDFRLGFTDLVGEDANECLEGCKEISLEDALDIQMRELDEDEYPTGDTISLKDALDDHIEKFGKVFVQLGSFNI